MADNWWEAAPKAGEDWWSAAPKADKRVPAQRPAKKPSLLPTNEAGSPWGAGTRNNPYDLSGGETRRRIGRGEYYIDQQGNMRRNDNIDAGNPIVETADSRAAATAKKASAPKKGFLAQRWDDASKSGAQAVEGLVANYKRNTLSPEEIGAIKRSVPKPAFASELARARKAKQRDWSGDTGAGPVRQAIGDITYPMRDTLDLVGNLGGLALSPLTGATDLATRPLARGMERAGVGAEADNLNVLNTGLMMLRPAPGRVPRPRASPVKRVPVPPEVRAFKGQDPAAMRARAEEFRAAGIDPALVDVVDDAGRGMVRATASRPTPARQAATDFRDARALDLPDRIGQQARRIVSSDPRSPVQIADEVKARRTAEGDRNFSAVRNEMVPLSPDAVAALRSPDGREAIRQAARTAMNSLDPNERNIANALNRLADDVLDAPGEARITVGMAQSISKTLLDRGEELARGGKNYAGSLQSGLGRAVRDNARQRVPGYDQALGAWEADSRLLNAAEMGPQFLRGNADEFGKSMAALRPGETEIARAAMRRAIEQAAGENIASAPGVARKIANAPEQRLRNQAALGPEDAARLQTNMGLEERLVRNANEASPRSGSPTSLNLQDAEMANRAVGIIGGARKIVSGDVVGFALDRLKTLGIRDDLAQSITEMAIDPARTDEALAALEQLLGPSQARLFMQDLLSPHRVVPAVAAAQSGRQR